LEQHLTLPDGVSDPRVAIGDGELVLACRYEGSGVSTVLWLALDVFLSGENELGLRVRKARAGALPLPIGDVVDQVTQRAEELELPLSWRQADGDPVALVKIPSRPERGRRMTLDALELRDGAVYLAGRTESR
ncbi:MAG: hypothetical protein WD176_01510, partial [Pirellulales bacterium]